ncbi:MAG: chemotaxis protein CheA, partial [Halanaerobiaceae bacterium]
LDRQKRLGDILVEEVKVTDKQINKIVKKQRESREALQSKTVRVDGSKLKEMINLVAELVIKQSRLKDLVINKLGESNEQKVNKQEIEATIQEVDKTIRDLQEKIMQANMVAVGDTFVRFRRLVRDLAEQAGKDIELKLIGTETELDKKVIEKIVDPLKHMIRNAVDHGIETVEERKAKGKSEKAVIKLSALQQEGGIIIEVEDDGRGLDASKIRKKAIENNLISESDSLSDEEIYQLIFEPGFSTSDSVSELSGRGVGMDVVATNIKELQGKVELKSEAGKGTKFIIKLPLTLAIIDGMLVKVANQLLIIPLSALVEFIELKLEQIKKVKEKGQVIAVRGNYIPLYFLDKLLNFDAESSNGKSNLVAIVKNEDTEIAISLDEILGQQQVVIKSLEKNFVNLKGISGATILGNGNVALILDIQALINLASA